MNNKRLTEVFNFNQRLIKIQLFQLSVYKTFYFFLISDLESMHLKISFSIW